jgi:selenocysteine-specific elongation factor
MPQTREHLAVLSLLRISRGAVVITKSDRVTPERVEAVRAEMDALLSDTPLAGMPTLPVSAQTGSGIGALRALLLDAARTYAEQSARHDEGQAFRLAIDRVFTLAGAGTVVTGTVHAGVVNVGDELALSPPADGAARSARVRSLHAQDRAVQSVHAGERCALALAGLARDQIERGQWLVDPRIALATDRIDVRLTLWRGAAQALRSGAHAQLHLGTQHVNAALALLDVPALAVGAGALAQLVLDEPISAWLGDRFILRDPAANRTLAGGTVLDPFAPARYRRTPQRLAELAALQRPSVTDRIHALLAGTPFGVDLDHLRRAQGLAVLPEPTAAADGIRAGAWALGSVQTQSLGTATVHALKAYHERQPDELGPDRARLRRLAAPRLAPALWDALLAHLASNGAIALHGPVVHLLEHDVQLSATETRLIEKTMPAILQAGFSGAWVRDLARSSGETETLTRTTLARLARRGELFAVVKDLYYAPVTVRHLAALAREAAENSDGEFKAAVFRDATGLGRKRAIQILEYFDRIGLTRRVGESHRLRGDCVLFM